MSEKKAVRVKYTGPFREPAVNYKGVAFAKADPYAMVDPSYFERYQGNNIEAADDAQPATEKSKAPRKQRAKKQVAQPATEETVGNGDSTPTD